MCKAVSIVGARPNFIKLGALEPYLERSFEHVIVHTGQHYDYELSKVFFRDLTIPEPDYFLGVGSGSHGYQVGEAIKRIESALYREKPDIVIVYGDTNSTLAGALAAVKAGFKVAHVEAGMRCYDMYMPEEINRRVVDHVSWLLFAPTKSAYSNLVSEKVPGEVFLTGDVHVDMLMRWLGTIQRRDRVLERLGLVDGSYVVLTVHRAENTDSKSRLEAIVKGILRLNERIVFPAHPRTVAALKRYRLYDRVINYEHILTIEPLGYLDFIRLLYGAKMVLTDSGGVQREAFLLGVPCVVLRDRTEWVELVESGWVRLAPDPSRLPELVNDFRVPQERKPLLGDGRAAERITMIIKEKVEAERVGIC